MDARRGEGGIIAESEEEEGEVGTEGLEIEEEEEIFFCSCADESRAARASSKADPPCADTVGFSTSGVAAVSMSEGLVPISPLVGISSDIE
jgi:hypothetical protein